MSNGKEKKSYADIDDTTKSITVRGVDLTIDPNVFMSIDFLELMSKAQNADATALVGLCKLVFGDNQYETVKKALKGENGFTPVKDIMEFFDEVVIQAQVKK
jgi:hypothetical protein